MNRTDTITGLPKELDYRSNDGLEVSLLWSESDNRLFVVVSNSLSGVTFELDVEASTALDVFRHPYAYAAFRGVDYAAARRRDDTVVPV